MENGHGGARPGAGRKSKASELDLAALLDSAWPIDSRKLAIMALAERALEDNKAAEILLAYTYGKPVARQEITGQDGGPIVVRRAEELSDDELAAIIAQSSPGAAAP